MADNGMPETDATDRDVLDATGRHPDEWFAFLDAQDATSWTRERMADWLRDEAPEVGDAWREAIIVRYEQARRMPGAR